MNILAYLDAGSGSLIIQAVLGGLAGLVVLFKTLRQRIARANNRAGQTPTDQSEKHESGR